MSTPEPRAYTAEEAREHFLEAARNAAHYWANLPDLKLTPQERCDGVVFSLLNIIDGTAGAFECSLDLTLSPHPDDQVYLEDSGENWYTDGMVINADVLLHEVSP